MKVDGPGHGGSTPRGALRTASDFDTLDIKEAVGSIGLIGPDPIDVDRDRGIAEKVYRAFRSNPAHVEVVVFHLTATLTAVADLESRDHDF